MGVKAVAALLALALPTTAAAATPGKPQHFKGLLRSNLQAPPPIRATGALSATVFVATTAGEADVYKIALGPAASAKLNAVHFEHIFLIGALLTTKTSGYSLSIKGIRLQRLSRSKRQFCVTAAITKPRPGQAVNPRVWFAMHIVSLSADPYRIDEVHWAIPKAWVLRDRHGKLLAVSHEGTNQQGKPITTGNAKACKA
jgi:hypothetical protein